MALPSGDLLVSYSDGITEAQNDTADEFGEQRILAVVNQQVGAAEIDRQTATGSGGIYWANAKAG